MITVLYAVDNIFVYRRFRSNKKLSNSDKPRDAFVQYAANPKTRHSPYVWSRWIWSFYVKGYGIIPQNWGALGPYAPTDGERTRPIINTPSPCGLSCVPRFKVTQGHWNRRRSIGYIWLHTSDP